MNWDHEPIDPTGDPLDPLLAEAKWPEPTPESIERLRRQWLALSGSARRRRTQLVVLSGLAAAAVVVGVAIWNRLGPPAAGRAPIEHAMNQGTGPAEPGPGPTVAMSPRPVPQPGRAAPPPGIDPPVRAAPPTRSADDPLTPRPPTAYERILLAAAVRQRAAAAEPSGPGLSVPQAGAAGSLPARASPATQGPSQADVLRSAATRLDSAALARWIQRQQDPSAQRVLLAALFGREDRHSVGLFLQYVADSKTSSAALEALDLAERVPVAALVKCLSSQDQAERAAAAKVLGRLNRPDVSQRLIEMVVRGTYRMDALVALLASPEPSARQFLARVEQDPSLAATLWNALRQFQNLSQWRS